MKKKTEKTEKKQKKDYLFQKGESGNPNGRPKGTKNFGTLYNEAVLQYAKENGITKQQAEVLFVKVGFEKALGGHSKFFELIMDRVFGKVKDKVEVTEKINEETEKRINKLLDKIK